MPLQPQTEMNYSLHLRDQAQKKFGKNVKKSMNVTILTILTAQKWEKENWFGG